MLISTRGRRIAGEGREPLELFFFAVLLNRRYIVPTREAKRD